MLFYDTSGNVFHERKKPDESWQDIESFIIAEPHEMISLKDIYNLDDITVVDCLNYDENIRHDVYSGYDFISLLYFYVTQDFLLYNHEMNVYTGENFCIWVLPNTDDFKYLEDLKDRVIQRTIQFVGDHLTLDRIYYFVWDEILRDYLNAIQFAEDRMNHIEDHMLKTKIDQEFFQVVISIRKTTYSIKKIMRPVLYIGDAILTNENGFIKKEHMRFFRSIDTRMNKLYDFSASLQEYANQMMGMYEGQIATQTNDVINKLTILTVFFTPLTIITGIYGMNFAYMPELNWKFGYLYAFLIMAATILIIYLIMKKNKWI